MKNLYIYYIYIYYTELCITVGTVTNYSGLSWADHDGEVIVKLEFKEINMLILLCSKM